MLIVENLKNPFKCNKKKITQFYFLFLEIMTSQMLTNMDIWCFFF